MPHPRARSDVVLLKGRAAHTGDGFPKLTETDSVCVCVCVNGQVTISNMEGDTTKHSSRCAACRGR